MAKRSWNNAHLMALQRYNTGNRAYQYLVIAFLNRYLWVFTNSKLNRTGKKLTPGPDFLCDFLPTIGPPCYIIQHLYSEM